MSAFTFRPGFDVRVAGGAAVPAFMDAGAAADQVISPGNIRLQSIIGRAFQTTKWLSSLLPAKD